jgi:predicted DsbA family dithiol-disulfide isomerase
MDADVVRELLAGDADAEDIRARDSHSRERGVNGVPTFVIANQHVVSGAQPAEMWSRVIEDILTQVKAQGG